MKITPVILAGGSGTRLWPISREDQPKQFLPLINSDSLFQDTLLRFRNSELFRYPVIVGNEIHRFMIQNQLKEIDWHASEIILEPFGKNTAPALTLASLRIKELIEDYSDTEDLILVLPADHYIEQNSKFENTIKLAVDLALSDRIITFGVTPNQPETGYGYICKGQPIKSFFEANQISKESHETSLDSSDLVCFEIEEFVEKPAIELAESYLKSGGYYWNSGIFMMKSSVWINAIKTFNKNLFDNCSEAILFGSKDTVFYRPEPKAFENCESIAIDYAVMENVGLEKKSSSVEKAFKSCVISLDVGWSDVGSWVSLADILRKEDESNIVRGDVYTDLTTNSIVIATDKMVVTTGIDNLVIVETGDAVLVVDKKSVQSVKNIVNQLKVENRAEQKNHLKIQRPWGSFAILDQSETYQVKKLLINPSSSISLQFHEHRSEHWVVVKGEVEVIKGESKFVLKENQSTYVKKGEVHRLLNLSDHIVEIIEVQTGSAIDEQDITRIKDDYDRENL
jgi:mannose-1-phosphate guanylyltransferase/mannose-6-phosphate isomerase